MIINIITLLLITFSVVYIIDFSGIITDLSKYIWIQTHPNQVYKYKQIGKPFGCSVCMTFWLSILYCIFGLNICIIYSISIGCGLSLSTNIFKNIINYYNKITLK